MARTVRLVRARLVVLIIGLLLVAGAITSPGAAAAAVPPPSDWYKVDLHQHSNFSGDARADLGISSAASRNLGYDGVMVTDHDRGANFQIQGANGHYLSYTEQELDSPSSPGRWLPKTLGPATSSVVARESTTVHSGTYAMHLAVSANAGSPTPARSVVYSKRGPSLRAGGITLDFWVFPAQIDANAGVDVSVSLGGDPTTGTTPFGYTANGTVAPGKSTVLVWQLGQARAATTGSPNSVYVNNLQYEAGVWNHYTVDVRTGTTDWSASGATRQLTGTGLDGLATADQPADYDVLSEVKMEAVSLGGTADAYFDDYVLRDLAPVCPAADFVYRNQLIAAGTFNGTNSAGRPFAIFPGREMGQNRHSNQFNFDITAPTDYSDTYSETTVPAGYGDDNALCSGTNSANAPWKFNYYGTENIPSVQASGYPAQSNHPGTTDTTAAVTATRAYGADLIEVLTGDDFGATWDSVLQQNHVVIGTYGSDSHEGVSTGAPATNIFAPSLTLDGLMRSLFEGRAYGARNTFAGRLIFNLDGSSEPYPARYPVYVPSGTSSAGVTLGIADGLISGQTVNWITNSGSGPVVTSDTVGGASYRRTFTVPLTGSFTYVRAEVRNSFGTLLASTQPIFFESVASMAAGSLHVDRVTPTHGCACSVAVNKGLTSLVSTTGGTLTGQLTNPPGSTVSLLGSSPASPTSVTMDGAPVAASASLATFQAATDDAWFYDATGHKLYLQDKQSGSTSTFSLVFPGGVADAPPTVPANVRAVTGSAAGTVDVSWSPSTDDDGTGVAGYRIYRDGSATPAQVGNLTSYTDSGLPPGSSHSYTVSSFDTAGNESATSETVTATASAGATSGIVTAVADAYVDSSNPTRNLGSSALLRTDTSPVINSYVRFSPSGFAGTITRAILSVHANSSLAAGIQVCTAADGAWTEAGVTSANAPAPDCSTSVIAKPAVSGARLVADVTGLMSTANGNVSFVLVGQSTTALSLASRESTNPPQLDLTTSGGGPVDAPPSVPQNVVATTGSTAGAITLTWSASTDSDGTAVAGYRVYRDGDPARLAEVTSGTSFTDTGLAPGSSHDYTVSAYDTANLESAQSAVATANAGSAAPVDNPPSVPQNVVATTGSTAGAIALTWSASTDTDATGVAGYRVYRDGSATRLAEVTSGTSFTDTGLAPGSSHDYTVSAYDTAGNESAKSATATANAGTAPAGGTSATVPAVADAYVDSSAPTRNTGTATALRTDSSPVVNSYLRFSPQGLAGSLTTATLSVYANSNQAAGIQVCTAADAAWTEAGVTSANAPAPDCSTSVIAKPAVSGARLVVDVTGLMSTVNGNVSFVLVGQSTTALSLASRESSNPPQLALTTSGGGPVDNPPSVPANVVATTGSTAGAIALTWSASTDTDATGVAGYRVYRDGSATRLAEVTSGTSFTDTGLVPGSSHDYTVSAYDTAGNESAKSAVATATAGGTVPVDNPPSVPANVVATTGSTAGAIALTWSASTDTDATGVAGYRVYRDGSATRLAEVTSGTSFTDTGLVPGSSHDYTVSAYDTANLESAQSAVATATAGGTVPVDNPPSVPQNVVATTGSTAGAIALTWSASTDTDATGVAGYRVYRDGSATRLAEVTSGTSFTDTGLVPGSSHDYTVSAYDTANLESGQSATATANAGTAPAGGTSATVTAVADAYVDSSTPTRNTGTATALRTDGSPVVNSYLRFSPQGLAGTLTSAVLSVHANSNLAAGFKVCTVADNTWSETGVTYANAPVPLVCPATDVVAKPAVAGSRVTVDVTSLLSSVNGDVSFVLVGQSNTALSLGSRESVNPPQLTLTTTG